MLQPGVEPFAVTVRDAARAIRASLSVPLAELPSRCEVFFIMVPTLPHGRFKATKAADLLGWEPIDKLEGYFSRL
jgi:nucleoside-diphosphate-sugar epimerase